MIDKNARDAMAHLGRSRFETCVCGAGRNRGIATS
jgi:hypothetical protein